MAYDLIDDHLLNEVEIKILQTYSTLPRLVVCIFYLNQTSLVQIKLFSFTLQDY